MRHPTEGVLRRLVDEPAGVADADRAHVADCPAVPGRRSDHRARGRGVVGAALAPSAPVDRLDAAWAATSPRPPADGAARQPQPSRPAAGGRACAVRWSQRSAPSSSSAEPGSRPRPTTGCRSSAPSSVAPVSVSPADLVALPDLSAYGDVEVDRRARRRSRSPDAAAAQQRTGLDVPEVAELPARGHRRPGLPGGRHQVERDVHLLGREGRAGRGRGGRDRCRRRPPGSTAASVRLEAGPGRGRGLVAGQRACPTLVVGPRRRADRLLLRRAVRDGARLPAVPARAARRPRRPAAHASAGDGRRCRCPCPPTWSPAPRPT